MKNYEENELFGYEREEDIVDCLEQFRINFHLFKVDVQDERLLYKSGLVDYSISSANQLIAKLKLPLIAEKLFDLPGNNQMVVRYMTREELQDLEDQRLNDYQMILEHTINSAAA